MDMHKPTDASATRGRIRDTAGQDQVMATKPAPRRRHMFVAAAAGVALLGAIAWLASGWMGGGRSYDGGGAGPFCLSLSYDAGAAGWRIGGDLSIPG